MNNHAIKKFLQVTITAAVLLRLAAKCCAGVIELEPYFEIETGLCGAQAWAYAEPDASDSDSTNPSGTPFYWSSETAEAFAETAHALAFSNSCVSLEWIGEQNRFVDHFVTNSCAYGSEIQSDPPVTYSAQCNTSARLKGLAGVQVNSTVYSSGYPVLARNRYIDGTPDPWQAIGNSSGGASSYTWDTNRVGPSWSMINERAHDWPNANYAVVQIGDKLELNYDGQANSYATSHGYDQAEFNFGWTNVISEFDIRPFTSEEIYRMDFHSLGRTFVGDPAYQYSCQYAAMAMIMDHWSHTYPELSQPSQTDYYEAFNRCREPNEPFGLLKFVKIMNKYFSNVNGCRSGGFVPLEAQQPILVDDLNPYELKDPLLVAGPQVDTNGQPLPPQINKGHSIVAELCDEFFWEDDDASWAAVRDTWSAAPILDNVVVFEDGNPPKPEYRGYSHEGKEWWPTVGLDEYLYFPDMDGYRFKPVLVIRVVRKWHNLELDSLDFDKDPNKLIDLELFNVKPAEATIIMPLDDEQKQMWKFYLKPGSPAQDINITFPTWVPMTSHVRLNIDYHLSPGAGVNVFANGFFLGQFTGPPMMKLLPRWRMRIPTSCRKRTNIPLNSTLIH